LTHNELEMVLRLLAAVLAGALIGYERSFHGRPAGFRTHALVCTASSLLMLVSVYEAEWVRATADVLRLDPTRMAQGIMTGIGFLGAGVIVKEGLTVRGLTTAASIWITAAIGVLAGVGLYVPLGISVVLTLGVLSAFRWIEQRMPNQAYYNFEVGVPSTGGLREEALRTLIEQHGFTFSHVSYLFDSQSHIRRRHMVLRTTDHANALRLSRVLEATDGVLEFRLSPITE
jgi:putative Mg2+ transporter-C (MgtC) family protein